jgi:hypothetical protein
MITRNLNSIPSPRRLPPGLARSCARLAERLAHNTQSNLTDEQKLRWLRFRLFGRIAEEQPQPSLDQFQPALSNETSR